MTERDTASGRATGSGSHGLRWKDAAAKYRREVLRWEKAAEVLATSLTVAQGDLDAIHRALRGVTPASAPDECTALDLAMLVRAGDNKSVDLPMWLAFEKAIQEEANDLAQSLKIDSDQPVAGRMRSVDWHNGFDACARSTLAELREALGALGPKAGADPCAGPAAPPVDDVEALHALARRLDEEGTVSLTCHVGRKIATVMIEDPDKKPRSADASPSDDDMMLLKLRWMRDTVGVDIERMFARALKENDGRAPRRERGPSCNESDGSSSSSSSAPSSPATPSPTPCATDNASLDPDDDGQVCDIVRGYLAAIVNHQDSQVAYAAALLLATLFTSAAQEPKQ